MHLRRIPCSTRRGRTPGDEASLTILCGAVAVNEPGSNANLRVVAHVPPGRHAPTPFARSGWGCPAGRTAPRRCSVTGLCRRVSECQELSGRARARGRAALADAGGAGRQRHDECHPQRGDSFRGYVRSWPTRSTTPVSGGRARRRGLRRAAGHDPCQGATSSAARDARRQARVPLCSDGPRCHDHRRRLTAPTTCAPTGATRSSCMEHRKARPALLRRRVRRLLRSSGEMTGDGAWSLTFDGVDRAAPTRHRRARDAGVLSSRRRLLAAAAHAHRAHRRGRPQAHRRDAARARRARARARPCTACALNLVVTDRHGLASRSSCCSRTGASGAPRSRPRRAHDPVLQGARAQAQGRRLRHRTRTTCAATLQVFHGASC